MKFKSSLITSASGSIGGNTFSRNAGGMYIRGRAMPTNPNTPGQAAVREVFGTLTNQWALLTPLQREGWAVYAQNVPLPDRLGDQRNVSGFNHFIRSNTPRLQAGLAIVSAAPTDFNIGPTPIINDFAVDTGGGVSGTVSPGTPGTAGEVLAYLSRPQNGTINYFRGPFVFTEGTSFASPGTTPVDLPTVLPYAAVADQKMFIRVQITLADGRLSADAQAVAIVTAP